MSINPYTPQQKKILQLVIIIAIGGFLAYSLSSYFSALVGAVMLYVLFKRPFNYLVKKKGWNRAWVTLLVILVSFAIIVLPFLLVSVMITNKIIKYSARVGEILDVLHKLEIYTGLQLTDKATIMRLAEKGSEIAVNWFPSFVTGALNLIVSIAIMYFALFYMYYSEKTFIKNVTTYLPFDDKTLNVLRQALNNLVSSNLVGQSIVSLVQAAALSLGFYFFDFPDAVFWGVIGFFLSFLPVLGTPIIWAPAGIIALMQSDTKGGVGMLLYGVIVVTNIDNLLRLAINREIGNIHPLITLVGVVIGVPFFGIMGLIIGPLLISYFLILIKVFENNYGKSAASNKAISIADPQSPTNEQG